MGQSQICVPDDDTCTQEVVSEPFLQCVLSGEATFHFARPVSAPKLAWGGGGHESSSKVASKYLDRPLVTGCGIPPHH